MKSKRWLWTVFFFFGLLLTIGLMTGWNLSFLHDYETLLHNSEKFRIDPSQFSPFATILLGALTAVSALGVMILFLIRLLREMRLNQLQEEFISSVTHEFRTPIAAMELSSSLLKEEWNARRLDDHEIKKLWHSHDEELRRLKREVEVLLTATRIDGQKKKNLDLSPIYLEDWLAASLSRWQKLLPTAAKVSRRGDPLDINSVLDLRSLDLIIDNILDNVRKYARGTPSLDIHTACTSTHWTIRFTDHGMGFPPADQKKIFQRFHRAKNDPTQGKIPGIGLGLFIAKSSATQMKLDLTADSPGIGKGCTFILSGAGYARKKTPLSHSHAP